MRLTKDEINQIRHWFNFINDSRPFVLTDADRELFCRIMGSDGSDTRAAERQFVTQITV